ncbi:hypothetical protein D3C72_1661280 [compost metagenome]
MHLVFHGAHLQAGRVGGLDDVALAVRHVAEAVFGPGQRDDALAREFGQDVLADGAVHDLAGVVVVAEQEGDVDDLDLGHEVAHGAGRGVQQVLRAELDRFDLLALAAQRRVGEVLALEAVLGVLLDLFAEHGGAHAVMRFLGRRIADLENGGLLREGGGAQGERKAGGGDVAEFHGVSGELGVESASGAGQEMTMHQ